MRDWKSIFGNEELVATYTYTWHHTPDHFDYAVETTDKVYVNVVGFDEIGYAIRTTPFGREDAAGTQVYATREQAVDAAISFVEAQHGHISYGLAIYGYGLVYTMEWRWPPKDSNRLCDWPACQRPATREARIQIGHETRKDLTVEIKFNNLCGEWHSNYDPHSRQKNDYKPFGDSSRVPVH